MSDIVGNLYELSNAHGPSGFEGPVRNIVRRELEGLCDNLETDGMGSLMGHFRGSDLSGPTVMIAAHMDEVGLMVRYITAEGYVKFQTLGGWLDQALINQRWIIHTKLGPVDGLTGIKTPHVMSAESRNQVFKRDGLFLDVGATSKEDAQERLGITPGDPITPDSKVSPMAGNNLLIGKAWDDRVGLAVMIDVLNRLDGVSISSNLYAVATVQEEVGLRGAQTSSYKIRPEVGVNLESGVAGDYPGTSQDESQEKLGKGPTIFLHDSSMIPNLALRNLFVETAEEQNISVQFDVLSGYGEDGAEMQRSHDGAPSINISVPTRYLHSHNSVINLEDVGKTVDLVVSVIKGLDRESVDGLRNFG